MKIMTSLATMRRQSATWVRLGEAVGLVPTMGALHEGHLTLIRRAREECRHVVVSIYVNPTQFGPGEDLARYPRPRRRDLALLKALGFTPRQLASVVAWQSTVTAVVGVIVGVPLGIVFGRQLWTVFARNINAVPDPTVPVWSVVLVGLGALVFANLVAALPGQIAARTPTANVLRAE